MNSIMPGHVFSPACTGIPANGNGNSYHLKIFIEFQHHGNNIRLFNFLLTMKKSIIFMKSCNLSEPHPFNNQN